jgi:hypothetical protein
MKLDETNSVWVVEMWVDEPGNRPQFVPVAGCGITREDARREMREYWKENNPDDIFRVTRYRRV